MNLDQNTLPSVSLAAEVTVQHAHEAIPERAPVSPSSPSATDYTPFVLALAVFVVVLKGYQRSS